MRDLCPCSNTKANCIRESYIPVPGRGLIPPPGPKPTHPTLSGWRVCVCVWVLHFSICWHKQACLEHVPYQPRSAAPCQSSWLVFVGISPQFELCLRCSVCVILNINQSPLPDSFPVPFSTSWLPRWDLWQCLEIQHARKLQRWKCATWWVYLGIDGGEGGVDKVKVGVARKFSGELNTLQMGTGTHINSVCLPFVSVRL